MSTSVINSARASVSTAFNLVAHVAGAADKLVRTSTMALDAIDAKTKNMRDQVILDCQLDMENYTDDAIMKAAMRRTNAMQAVHESIYTGKSFNREEFFEQSLANMKRAAQGDKP